MMFRYLIHFLKSILLRLLPLYHKLYVLRLRYKKKINVVFFAMSLSMWRYQYIYELLSKHPKFNTYIVISPCIRYSNEMQKRDIDVLEKFFNKKNISVTIIKDNDEAVNLRKLLSPDILFYPQPYNSYLFSELAYQKFYDKLLCYCPYAFWMSKGAWSYNQPLHKIAWKLFYPTKLHKQDAYNYSFRKGNNMEVVGYPTADDFLSLKFSNVWKPQIKKKKRIIWAPHFTIFSGGPIKQSNFLWMANFMIDLSIKYSESIQFVFKPHPHLFSELCKHSSWGEEKAYDYYKKWDEMNNTQLETGDFVDLFMTSDAMIHDSGSFCVEYHYTGNPVMFIAENFEEQIADMAVFGQLAMRQQYVGRNQQDIIDFIENVILNGNDPMKQGREEFRKEYLLPPNGKTVATNIMDVFLKTFC